MSQKFTQTHLQLPIPGIPKGQRTCGRDQLLVMDASQQTDAKRVQGGSGLPAMMQLQEADSQRG